MRTSDGALWKRHMTQECKCKHRGEWLNGGECKCKHRAEWVNGGECKCKHRAERVNGGECKCKHRAEWVNGGAPTGTTSECWCIYNEWVILCFLLLLYVFIVYLSSCTQRQFLSKALVYYCFLVFRHIGEYISLDLFYEWTHRMNKIEKPLLLVTDLA